MRPFSYRMRAYSAAHMPFDEKLQVVWGDGSVGILQSEYTGGADGKAYAVTIHGEIRGPAASLDDALSRLANMLGSVLPVIALAANAPVLDPQHIAAHGLDLTEPQPLLVYETPPAGHWPPPVGRTVPRDAVHALASAVGAHPQAGLLHQAIEAYRWMLRHWNPRQRLVAGEFLYICAETLSRCILESRAAAAGVTPKRLAKDLGYTGSGLVDALRADILRHDIFAGESATLEDLQDASNGFEHGYMPTADARARAERAVDRAAQLVRRALIETAAPDPTVTAALLSSVLAEARGVASFRPVARGTLARTDDNGPVPASAEVFLEVEWDPQDGSIERTTDGALRLATNTGFAVRGLHPDTRVSIEDTGLWAENVRLSEADPD